MAKRLEPAPPARAVPQGIAAVYLPLDALHPNPRNPRAHGAEVVRLARTILRTTWGAPIIAQASTRRIIGGHGRLEAARLIAEGIEVDGIVRGGPEHRFDRDAPAPLLLPVRLVDVSDAEADAMTLADNARALQGNDDAAAVVAMATAAFERDADVMRDMGYGAADLDALVKAAGDAVLRDAPAGDASDVERHEVIGDVPQGEDPGAEEPPPDAPVHSRAGEVYELGPHRLVCGDNRDAAVLSLALDTQMHAVVTDPPYGIDASSMTMGSGESAKPRRSRLSAVDPWDGAAPPVRWLLDIAPFVCVWGGNYFQDLPVSDDWLVWHKKNDGLTFAEAELAWTNSGRRIRLLQHHWSGEKKVHITQKPLPVMVWSVSFAPPHGVVFDPFAGSGTTLIACAQTSRVARLIELDPRYCDVIRRRWTKYARSAGVDPGAGALD
jgi:site-specific DNA-methyltransferase (adenine-specific)/modification methylase